MLVENGYKMQKSSTNDTPTSHNNVFFVQGFKSGALVS